MLVMDFLKFAELKELLEWFRSLVPLAKIWVEVGLLEGLLRSYLISFTVYHFHCCWFFASPVLRSF